MKYSIQTIVCGTYQENAYLLMPDDTKECIVIDPGDDIASIRDSIVESGRMLRAMVLTHGHFDHMLSAQPIARATGAQVYCHADDIPMLNDAKLCAYDRNACALPCPDALHAQPYADEIDLCGIRFKVLHTPGHTPGSVCLYDEENKILFTGDTLFCAGFGRTDLPGGSNSRMRASLFALFALPKDVRVYPGHGEDTTIGAEVRRYGI